MPPLDLDAYLARIGYTGTRAPTLEVLRALHALHPLAIPFENFNALLGWPVRLDLPSLQKKLVQEPRGGYCFEQNLLLKSALDALGFRVKCLAARVLWNQPEDIVTPRTHMLLQVSVDDIAYAVDVGFGGQTLTAPLRFDTEAPQATTHEEFRLLQEAQGYLMQSRLGDAWKSLYRFSLEEQHLIDYELSSYYVSTHPNSHFLLQPMVARVFRDRRCGLRGRELATHWLKGGSERRTLTSAAEIRSVLHEIFGIQLPEGAPVDAALLKTA